jgi:hypothetical protein
VSDHLRVSADRVNWWGDLAATLPELPSSERLHRVITAAADAHDQRRAEKAARPRIAHLARAAEGSTEWLLIIRDTWESTSLTPAEAALPDEALMERYRLAALTRGDYWSFTIRPS